MTIITICYGKVEKWESKDDAIKSFMEGMVYCDGAEQERYANIVSALIRGSTVAWDGYEVPEGWRVA